MLRICKFVTASAFLLGSFAAGRASTISLGSFATTAANPGFDNSATYYVPSSSMVNSLSSSTYDIGSSGVWHDALGASSYVSFNAGTGSNLTYVAPNGDYIYTTTFSTPSKSSSDTASSGTLTVLADDTLSVFLNGVLIAPDAGAMGAGNHYSHCSDWGVGCLTPWTFTFDGILSGVNVLTFDVKQVNGANTGLDYLGSITSIPEPGSLTLMGTGIAAMAGLVRRRFAK